MRKQKPFLQTAAMLVRRDIHKLEYDPATQYHFHFVLTWFWCLSMIGLPFVPVLWGHTVPALVVQEISLWANFATHFGAMGSALAAKSAGQTPTHAELLEKLSGTRMESMTITVPHNKKKPRRAPPADF